MIERHKMTLFFFNIQQKFCDYVTESLQNPSAWIKIERDLNDCGNTLTHNLGYSNEQLPRMGSMPMPAASVCRPPAYIPFLAVALALKEKGLHRPEPLSFIKNWLVSTNGFRHRDWWCILHRWSMYSCAVLRTGSVVPFTLKCAATRQRYINSMVQAQIVWRYLSKDGTHWKHDVLLQLSERPRHVSQRSSILARYVLTCSRTSQFHFAENSTSEFLPLVSEKNFDETDFLADAQSLWPKHGYVTLVCRTLLIPQRTYPYGFLDSSFRPLVCSERGNTTFLPRGATAHEEGKLPLTPMARLFPFHFIFSVLSRGSFSCPQHVRFWWNYRNHSIFDGGLIVLIEKLTSGCLDEGRMSHSSV